MKCASDFRMIARNALRGRWGVAVATAFVAQLLGGTLWSSGGGISFNFSSGTSGISGVLGEELSYLLHEEIVAIILVILGIVLIFAVVFGLVMFAIGGAAKLGYAAFNLNLVDGKPARFSDLFSQFGRIGQGIVMNLLLSIFTALWALLFIIPGIIKSYSYAMTPFILAENPHMNALDAITRSRQVMDGNKWRLFCLQFSFIGWALLLCAPLVLSLVLFVIAMATESVVLMIFTLLLFLAVLIAIFVGQLFLVPYQNAAMAAFYRDITAAQETDRFYGTLEF